MSTSPQYQQCIVCHEWYDPAFSETRITVCGLCRTNLSSIITKKQVLLDYFSQSLVTMIENLSEDDSARYTRMYHALCSATPETLPEVERRINITRQRGDAVSKVVIMRDTILAKQDELWRIRDLEALL